MRIVKRLSLNAAFYRWDEGGPNSEWLKRKLESVNKEQILTPEEEISKYGYKVKQHPLWQSSNLLFISFIGLIFGISYHIYTLELYRNQLKVRNKYRVQERQNPSLKLWFRYRLFNLIFYTQRNMFLTEYFGSQQKKENQISRVSEQMLRFMQYKHYKQNRDNKFEFMDLGILDKYPFPPPPEMP